MENRKQTGFSDRLRLKRIAGRRSFRLSFFTLTILLGVFSPLLAQETVDSRSGRLLLTVSDLILPAGPVDLEIKRTLQPNPGKPGLLGSRWRLNVERRLVKEKTQVRIEGEPGPIGFFQKGTKPDYKNDRAGEVRLEKKGRAVWNKRDGTKETFDPEGRLIEIEYRNYNKVILSYGPDKRLARIEGPRKHLLKLKTDPQGRIIGIEASSGDQLTFQYEGENLSQVQVNGTLPLRYQYDGQGRLIRIEDPKTGVVEITYDSQGRVLSRRFADGGKETHTYSKDGNEHQVTEPLGGKIRKKWTADGSKEETINPLGHKTIIEYNSLGLPVAVTDALGNRSQMTYNKLGRITGLKDMAGQTTRFEYLKDAIFRSAITFPDGSKQTNQYDGQMNLTEVRRGTQTIFQQTYYPDGLVKSSKALGQTEERYTYDQAGRLLTQGNVQGHQTRFEYDGLGNLLRRTNPLGGVTLFKYNEKKQLISITDPGKGTTQYQYNPQGFLSKTVDSAGGIKSFQYDAMGRIVATTSLSGQKTLYEYDQAGRITRKGFPDGRSERFNYDRVGNLIVWINAQGLNHQFKYDPLGRLIKEETTAGLEISYSYDIQGNLVSWRDSAGGGEDLRYDGLGRMTDRKTLTGSTMRYSYDTGGRLTSITNSLGQVKKFAYDQSGNLSEVSEPEGTIGRYTFDYAGRLMGIKHPSGGETRFAYDSLGNVLSLVDPLGRITKKTFDAAGRLKTVSLSPGQSFSYNYNSKGLVVEKILPDQKKILYQYDLEGNPLQIENGTMIVRFNHDAAGRLSKLTYPHLKKTLTYEYNSAGFISKLVDSEGQTTLYEYDKANHLKSIKAAGGKAFYFTYDQKDRLKSLTYPNGLKGDWEYDPEDRIVRLTYSNSQGGPLLTWQYRYDSDGNRLETVDQKGRRIRYRYDPAGQLIEETPEGEDPIHYSYSPGGNRIKKEGKRGTITYRIGQGDQLVQAGQETMAYDHQGNLIEIKGPKGVKRYVYDPENRLIKVIKPDQSEITYGYSPTGERAWRKDSSGLTTFITDGVNLQAELQEDLRPKALYLHAPGVDRPLMMTRDGKRYYYLPDATGNIVALTDDTGSITARYEYDAFGIIKNGPEQFSNPFTFSAREFDPETGLYYFRARYYDPELGRFLSKDPVSPALDRPYSLNPYLYAGNNPLRYLDPFGQDFTPAELLYIAESDARYYRDLAQNPQKYGLPQGAFHEEYLADAQRLESKAQNLRNRHPGLTPQRPALYGPSPISSGASAESGSRGPRVSQTQDLQVQRPPRLNQTIPVDRPPAGLTPAQPSGPGGITRPGFYGTVGGLMGLFATGVNLEACLEEGNSKAWCYGELGLGVAGGVAAGVVIGAGVVYFGVPATVVAVGGTVVAVGGALLAGDRLSQAPETKALNEQLAAQEGQTEKRVKNVLAALEGRIGSLIALGKDFCTAQTKVSESATKAKNTAEATKKNLESTLSSLNAEVTGSFMTNCTQEQKKLVGLLEKIKQAEDSIDKAGRGYPEAIQRMSNCFSQKDIDDADSLFKRSIALSQSAEKKLREALGDINALQKSIPKLKESATQIRNKMNGLENTFLANKLMVDGFVSTTETDAQNAEAILAKFKGLKAELLQSASKLTAIMPPKFEWDLKNLMARINNAALPCPNQVQTSVTMAKTAKESISGGSLSSLSGLGSMLSAGMLGTQKLAIDSALNACGNLNPPTGQEVDNASLALQKLTNQTQDWLKKIAEYRGLCLAKLYPKPQPPAPSKPPTTTTAQAPPNCTYTYSGWSPCQPDGTQSRTVLSSTPQGCQGTPVLNQICTYKPPPPPPPPPSVNVMADLLSCNPDPAKVGQTIRCSVVFVFEKGGQIWNEDVTEKVRWEGAKPPYVAKAAGSVTFTASYLGFKTSGTVKVVEGVGEVKRNGYDPRKDPGLPDKGKPADPDKIKGPMTGFQGGTGQGTRPPKPEPSQPATTQPTGFTQPSDQPGTGAASGEGRGTGRTGTALPGGGSPASGKTIPPAKPPVSERYVIAKSNFGKGPKGIKDHPLEGREKLKGKKIRGIKVWVYYGSTTGYDAPIYQVVYQGKVIAGTGKGDPSPPGSMYGELRVETKGTSTQVTMRVKIPSDSSSWNYNASVEFFPEN